MARAGQAGYGRCCQPCPACGGLECLCRPRFFAGQLLTEQDLNRLDHYITEKHKLHNRHLFGPGVVCGLEVRCDPCDERVTVMPGYALSPCGEDIVVCHADSVDICDLIARCRDYEGPDCRPYARGDDPCEAVIEEWVLAIRYAETPSRAVTPLTGTASCNCGAGGCKGRGCACGGGCGCKGGGAARPTRAEAVSADLPPAPRRATDLRAHRHLRDLSLRCIPQARRRDEEATRSEGRGGQRLRRRPRRLLRGSRRRNGGAYRLLPA